MPKGYVYILLCSNGHFYTGSTKNLELRINEHFKGLGANYTKKFPPQKLVFSQEFENINDAYQWEKRIQKWNKNKKEALINGDFELLKELSKNKSDSKS